MENPLDPTLLKITVPVVEPILELAYALHRSIHLLVPTECHDPGEIVCFPDLELRIEGSDVCIDCDCFTCHLSLNIFDPEAF